MLTFHRASFLVTLCSCRRFSPLFLACFWSKSLQVFVQNEKGAAAHYNRVPRLSYLAFDFALLLNDEELFDRFEVLPRYRVLNLDCDLIFTRNKEFGVDESGKNETLT